MRAVVQRVSRAAVTVEEKIVGAIDAGLCIFVGVMAGDEAADAVFLAKKVAQLRIFEDSDGKMNLSVQDICGSVLAISQFTLAGDVRKGNRPSFISAMEPGPTRFLFDEFCSSLRVHNLRVETGTFRAHMDVKIMNDGPVTILLDTRRTF